MTIELIGLLLALLCIAVCIAFPALVIYDLVRSFKQ